MKTTKILKFIIATIVIVVTLLVTNAVEVQAALQANPNTQYTKTHTPEDWMKNFRQMETAGGAMGLNETLNKDLTALSDSNNMDVHMMRTTEYGAIAILSASGYGNPSNDRAITSTTGNNTGIMLNTSKYEWVAGGLQGSIFSGTNSRYYDTYTTDRNSARVGDALGNATTTNPGCAGWHSASDSAWIYSSSYPYFIRGNGGIFSFTYANSYIYYGRGVAVSGTGL